VQLKLQGADREHRRLVWRQPRQGDSNYSVVEEASPVLSPAATVNIRYNSFRMMPRPRGPDGRFIRVYNNNGSWLQTIESAAEILVATGAAAWIWSKLSGNRVPAAPVGPVAPAVPVQPVAPAVPVGPVAPAVPVQPEPIVAPVLPVAPVAPVEQADREGKDDQKKQNAINRVNPGVFYQFNDVYHVDERCSILPNGSKVQAILPNGSKVPPKFCDRCLHQL